MLKFYKYSIAGLALLGMGVPFQAIAQTDPSGTWLDTNPNWNTPGADLPQAPIYPDGNNLPNCDIGVRTATLPEDALVEAAGWTLLVPQLPASTAPTSDSQ
jgi:hypothetical protein